MRAFFVFSLLFVLSVSNSVGADNKATPGPELLAMFSTGTSASRTLFVYSKIKLRKVCVWHGGSWLQATEEENPHQGTPYHLYRVASIITPADDQRIALNSWDSSGAETYRHEIQVEKADDSWAAETTLITARNRGQYAADKQAYQRTYAADPYGFVVLLNQYRAARGLAPVAYDAALSQDAQTNNSMASPHGYMGRARVQNWAQGYGGAAGVLRGWQNSPGHNRNLLNAGIRRVGIARNGSEWTMNGS